MTPAAGLDTLHARGWIAAGLFIVLSFAFPLGAVVRGTPILMLDVLLLLCGAAYTAVGWTRRLDGGRFWLALGLVLAGAASLLLMVHEPGISGAAGLSFWCKAIGVWLAGWMAVDALIDRQAPSEAGARLLKIAVPTLFGAFLFIIWEWVVVGFGVNAVLMPPPSAILGAMLGYAPTLAADFVQTFLKSVITGWALGSVLGFLVAVLADAVPFLRRGLLPLGNFVSALPIIGVAPIMVMWFGFDWQSKVAVVVIMTFFPMLVNTVAGLAAAGRLERDLMRSYGAGRWATLIKLRLPAAMPFIFNGLKINSTLALIGAIVAEFFGTPIVGMGFRISTEVGRMALDKVWAEIVVAAVAGSAFYGIIAAVERAVTFWHPSYRRA
ncbi:NitT/TauT family transport system permease protein [Labrys wisconsinensis]|uniref:NitT/TauT family transport system permease protein n=2 Tax=Labrys wisconsinensis TaxID=425677 RepID=A0ABU0J688_9HYPH|nr:NitT/TauT family transport system permease protein [Labrys wisconsinensis]